ncbi:nucleotidyltransferase family protein, partial [Acidobacteria bacterium AH-259-D05]|nr:nucleotidyltransferase family protein [Acidobacteria bacterium AH-259-D05]
MITQILLAAGLSTRMKTPKPLLDFGGVPLLSRLLEECRHSVVDRIVVVLGHEKEKILEQVDFSGICVVVNSHYTKGQTSSFQCALQNLDPETEAFLNLPVDHPLVSRREIDQIVEAYRSRKPEAKIFIPEFEGQPGRPVLFDIALAKEILALSPEEPVNGIIERLPENVSFVPIANPYTMKDMDTPEDYRECLE